MRPITKSLIVANRQCPQQAWRLVHTPELAVVGEADSLRATQGEAVGLLARKAFGPAAQFEHLVMTTIPGTDLPIKSRMDVIDGDTLIEVKSSSSVKDHQVEDAAIQAAVMTWAGQAPTTIELMHPDAARTLTEDSEAGRLACLSRDDVTERVIALVPFVAGWAKDAADTINGPMPVAVPGAHCADPYNCPFSGTCGKYEKAADSTDCLPSHAGEVGDLIRAGLTSLHDLPGTAMTHERNLLVWQAVTSNSTIVRPSLADFLRSAAYPRLYLDFEAVSEPLPRFVGMRPHSPLAFQWSVHIERQPGAAPEQMGYLEEEGADPREAFARSLIEFCGDTGPVFVYSPYEQSRLKDLCEQLPALRPQLEAIMARLVDLLPHMRRGFYAPRMKGSWSIKKIMPCLPGGVDYEALGQQVANGDAAQAAYLTIANPATPDTERQRLIQELLVYCPTDTLALYQLVNTIPTMPTTAPNVTFPPKAPKSRKKALQPV